MNWFKNRDEMLAVLPQVEQTVMEYLVLLELLSQGEKLQAKVKEETAFLEGAEDHSDHLILTLEQRSQPQAVHIAPKRLSNENILIKIYISMTGELLSTGTLNTRSCSHGSKRCWRPSRAN